MKKCKYHCNYGDGENCHYEGECGCIYVKGRKLTDAESMGMLFDDALDIPDGFIPTCYVKENGISPIKPVLYGRSATDN